MIRIQQSILRLAAFLLLAAAVCSPISLFYSSWNSVLTPAVSQPVLTADGTLPPPQPKPIKQL
jgi:hypothetical protein